MGDPSTAAIGARAHGAADDGPAEDRSERDLRWSQLMVAAQDGDVPSYQALLEEFRETGLRYLRSRFGAVEWSDDCIQEALMAVHRARHTYDPKQSIAGWVFAIVRNKAIDHLRKRGSNVSRAVTADEELDERAEPTPRSADSAIDASRALRDLDPNYAKALFLTKVEGYTVEEAAGLVGISHTAMRTRVSRAVRMVKRWMESDAL